MLHTPALIYTRIKGKRVRISCVSFGTMERKEYVGVVVNDYTTGFDLYIELDDGTIINTRYIESIDILG